MTFEYLREDLKSLKPYEADQENCTLKLNANESPYPIPLEIRAQLATELLNGNEYQLYPDSNADSLRDALAKKLNVERDNILIGNGSDELINIVTTAFANPGDKVLCPSPGFSMVNYYTRLAGAIPIEYHLNERLQYSLSVIEQTIITHRPKILHICTPNNPAGSTMSVSDIASIAQWFDGVVVVDEAYYEFYGESMLQMIDKYPNIVILRTFSKAMGMAGLRVGYLICSKTLASEIYLVKPPYNVNSFSQRAAELLLEHPEIREKRVKEIVKSREWLFQALNGLRGVEPYPSQANFILAKVKNSSAVFRGLMEKGILVRHFGENPMLKNHIRITVGRAEDNKYILQCLAEILSEMEGW